jgi:hypothetical protein
VTGARDKQTGAGRSSHQFDHKDYPMNGDIIDRVFAPAPTPDVPLLELIRQCLSSSGVEAVADVAIEDRQPWLEDRHLMARDRRIAITTEVRDVSESSLHAHVICWLPNPTAPDGKDKLDACVYGYGAMIDDAAKQAAEVWLRLVGAPVLSCLAARPVLDADHFEGNEEWGVPGGHGFVGPLALRGKCDTIDSDILARSNAFRFDGYPRDERCHLAKATLLGQDGRWTRNLEIDGHAFTHADEDWALGPPAPQSPVVCIRFAVFVMGQ